MVLTSAPAIPAIFLMILTLICVSLTVQVAVQMDSVQLQTFVFANMAMLNLVSKEDNNVLQFKLFDFK